jgi:hypothetical protein
MDAIMEKSSDRSRSMLFGLLISCLLFDETMSDCPLTHLRESLTLEEKYDFVMELDKQEVDSLVRLHTKCFSMKISHLMRFHETKKTTHCSLVPSMAKPDYSNHA